MSSESEYTRVSIVDDDPAMLRILAAWLTKAGYQVQTFGDSREALAAIENDPPDFLITDWEMPYMTGIELCHRVRELKLARYIYLIFLTVRSAPTEMIEGLEIGADDFLSKPVHQGELLARVRAGARIIELERRLGMLARTDYLTGLMTQRVFYESLDKEWARVQRTGAPLSCVMMDIDFFKKVNDVHGHPAGDAVLRKVADVLRHNSRAPDVPCRYGGEEFCILLPETNEDNATQWADRIRRQLAEATVVVDGKHLRVTASFGVTERRGDTDRPQTLVDQADQALLYAKQSGRNRVIRFESLSESDAADDLFGERGTFAGVRAEDVMSPIVTSLREDETIGNAAEFFLRLRVNSTCVVDAAGNLAGILSEKDLLSAIVSFESWDRPIREVMKSNVISYEADAPLQTIYQFLCRVSIRRVVILRDGLPVGTISRGTLLRWFRNLVVARRLSSQDTLAAEQAQDDRERTHERLLGVSQSLADQAAELCRECRTPSESLAKRVAGQATQIQDLLRDVLAFSDAGQNTAASTKS
ncbi:MAG TPA: diguanylate cyclase [Thermoguttaceae bacterium]|nr:diguanylate cyclase [Thermoguttaceae bacterium]